jgi:hypothetical protein
VGYWIKGELNSLFREMLLELDGKKSIYFNNKFIKDLFNIHLTEKKNYEFPLWNLLVFKMWSKTYLNE